MTGVDVEDLADVAVGLRPTDLVAPGLLTRVTMFSTALPLPTAPACGQTRCSGTARSPRPFRASDTRGDRRAICRALVSLTTRRATGMAPGVMLNSVSPQPMSSLSSSGSEAISPQTETGNRSRVAAAGPDAAAEGPPDAAAGNGSRHARRSDRQPACTESDRSSRW